MIRQSKAPTLLAASIAALALFALSSTLVWSGADAGRAATDSVVYHERVVQGFIEEFPNLDCRNPLSTTTPGYHVLIAMVGRVVSEDRLVLRLASCVLGAAMVALASGWIATRRGLFEGLLLALPLACSVYVVGSAAWILPDDTGWLLVIAVLALCLKERWGWRRAASVATALLALVLVRQVHLWAAAPVALACAARGGWTPERPTRLRVFVAALTVLPAFIAVGAFAVVWHGLVPPRFQDDVYGINPATPAFVLAQFAIAGVAFLPWLWRPVQEFATLMVPRAFCTLTLGVLVAAIPATVPDRPAGRFSGWWSMMEHAPSIGGHANAAMLVLAPAGAVLLVAAISRLNRRDAAIVATAVIAFVVAVSSTHYSWQRYHEPFVLLMLAIVSMLQPEPSAPTARSRSAMAASIGALCALLLAVTWRGLSGDLVDPATPVPPEHLMPGECIPARAPGPQSKSALMASPTAGR